ncbi:MAG TPA: TIM barrel protein [Actinomycetota bacterium]|nr:TIM barrel protein [Actinomycetota bacterium]
MTISLGVDTLCWHMPLEAGLISVEDVLRDAASLGAAAVALNLHHTRERSVDAHAALSARAGDLGLRVLAQGDFLGSPRLGDEPSVGVDRIRGWLERATALGSPTLRLASGFYRAELAARPDLIEAERRYVTGVLLGARDDAEAAGIRLVVENHSDFLVSEYEEIVHEVGTDHVGVFLDLINPIMTFDDPFRAIEVLAPLARNGHVRDFELISAHQPDRYHRRGFDVRYRYPGEGVAPLAALVEALSVAVGDRPYDLLIEGLDSTADTLDQHDRLARCMPLVRDLLDRAAVA